MVTHPRLRFRFLFFGVLRFWSPGHPTRNEQDQPPPSGQFKKGAPPVAVPLPALSLRSPLRSTPQPLTRFAHPSGTSLRSCPSSLRSYCHHVPQSLHIMTPAPASIDSTRARIGKIVWRVRSKLARTAAGRVRPQQETFRRPTSILVDPGPSSAASVLTDFARKVRRQAPALRHSCPPRVASPEGSGCRRFASANA